MDSDSRHVLNWILHIMSTNGDHRHIPVHGSLRRLWRTRPRIQRGKETPVFNPLILTPTQFRRTVQKKKGEFWELSPEERKIVHSKESEST